MNFCQNGGDDGSRTRVQKGSEKPSTCLAHLFYAKPIKGGQK